ncbi:MAG: hypothetical protein E6L05_01510 [Thaumarchaeota archaeon]|nr:MAG: hypothetical protein E6L05_01510 [Nitrososphaerota archaeon]
MIENMEKREFQTTDKGKKMNKRSQICVFAGVLAALIVVTNFGFAWADTGASNTNTILASDNIKNDPTAMKILQNIELFKQRYAAMQQKQQLVDQQNQIIEQQRKLAGEYLQADLAGMNNGNNLATPKNAYAVFVTHVDNSAQNLFWEQFNFMQAKVQNGKDAMNRVLKNGGTMQEALQAYSNEAAIHKDQLISINKDLNVKYNLADGKVQSLFNKDGKLNRNA